MSRSTGASSPLHAVRGKTSAGTCDSALEHRVFFPPGEPPPGVHVSDDGASVAAPLCVMEWFISFFDACCELEESDSDSDADGAGAGPREGACEMEREQRCGGGATGQNRRRPQGTPPCVQRVSLRYEASAQQKFRVHPLPV